MLLKIKCPACKIEGTISLIDPNYEGPYRCWKCRSLYSIVLKSNKLISTEPMTEEELQKQQEIKAMKDKLNRQFPGRMDTG